MMTYKITNFRVNWWY